jgi:outer membrane PBP1 activator LpoA protein
MGGKPNKLASLLTARRLLLAAITTLLLVACGSTDLRPADDTAGSPAQRDQIQQLLRDADNSPAPRRQAYLLEAAGLLLEADQTALAGKLLTGVDTRSVDIDLQLQHQLLLARWQLASDDPQAALNSLETETFLLNEERLNKAQRRQLGELRAASQALLGNHLASATERVYLNPLLRKDAAQANADALWRELMHLPQSELTARAQATAEPALHAWLSLAAIAKDNRGDLAQQLQQLQQWRADWPQHPAAVRLPGGLELLQQLAASQPRRIALLLPLSGALAEYGQAVLDGFMAAYYETRSHGGYSPAVRVYDTNASEDIAAIHALAVRDGAELVVGPLDKQRVRQLAQQPGLAVPTLALNRVDDDVLPPLAMFQFALAPEDEARQLAYLAGMHHQRAMILAPDTERGARVVSSFAEQWQAQGGDIVAEGYYQEQKDYSKIIEHALHLDQSQRRAARVRQVIQQSAEFTPRRRQDIELIMLQARPQQARSLVPLLAYHYAGDIPVYSTSQVYTGVPSKADNDLNGVRFTDMPWVLTPDPLRQQLEQLRPQAVNYRRLAAFGADSYQLYPRLPQLETVANSRLYGKTGTLRLNARRQLERDSLLAQFKRGTPTVVPVVEGDPNKGDPRAKELPDDETGRRREAALGGATGRTAGG